MEDRIPGLAEALAEHLKRKIAPCGPKPSDGASRSSEESCKKSTYENETVPAPR